MHLYRPTLTGAARRSAIARLVREYRRALLDRDVAHDAAHGWGAIRRNLGAAATTNERNLYLVRSIRQRSARNARVRRAAARINPGNVGVTDAARKATLAYAAQAFRYRLVRLYATK